jgi:hypothetical protein
MKFADIPRPAFGRAAQHADAPKPLRTRSQVRRMREAKLAAELLPELPAPGETIHCLMTGGYDLTQVIVATTARMPTLRHLRIATLCFSKRNAAELIGLVRSTPSLALSLLVSVFFKEHNKELFEAVAADFAALPAARLAAARSHCKVVCFDGGDATPLVFEGSANLRTNKNREQLTATRDRALHDWHAAWIDAMVKQNAGKPGNA